MNQINFLPNSATHVKRKKNLILYWNNFIRSKQRWYTREEDKSNTPLLGECLSNFMGLSKERWVSTSVNS